MNTEKSEFEKTVEKRLTELMFKVFSDFGWVLKTGSDQLLGSAADIYAELKHENHITYYMKIDDGYCDNELSDAVYHIYCGNFQGKILEGRICNPGDFSTAMKILGFKKIIQ